MLGAGGATAGVLGVVADVCGTEAAVVSGAEVAGGESEDKTGAEAGDDIGAETDKDTGSESGAAALAVDASSRMPARLNRPRGLWSIGNMHQGTGLVPDLGPHPRLATG